MKVHNIPLKQVELVYLSVGDVCSNIKSAFRARWHSLITKYISGLCLTKDMSNSNTEAFMSTSKHLESRECLTLINSRHYKDFYQVEGV